MPNRDHPVGYAEGGVESGHFGGLGVDPEEQRLRSIVPTRTGAIQESGESLVVEDDVLIHPDLDEYLQQMAGTDSSSSNVFSENRELFEQFLMCALVGGVSGVAACQHQFLLGGEVPLGEIQ